MNRQAWALFAATSVIWGSSFLFIRLAVTDMIALGAWLATRRPRRARP